MGVSLLLVAFEAKKMGTDLCSDKLFFLHLISSGLTQSVPGNVRLIRRCLGSVLCSGRFASCFVPGVVWLLLGFCYWRDGGVLSGVSVWDTFFL